MGPLQKTNKKQRKRTGPPQGIRNIRDNIEAGGGATPVTERQEEINGGRVTLRERERWAGQRSPPEHPLPIKLEKSSCHVASRRRVWKSRKKEKN